MTGGPQRVSQQSSLKVNAYICVVVVLAIAGVVASWLFVGPPRDVLALLILCAMGILSFMLKEPDVGSRVGFSFLSIVVIASIVIIGPVGCAIVGALSMGLELGHPQLRGRIFNASMSALLGALGGLAYRVLGGELDLSTLHSPLALILHVGVPLMVANLAQMLANAALLAGIVRIDQDVPVRRVFVQMVTNSGVAYLGYGVIGLLFVILWLPADVGPFSAVLILAPLFVARWAFVQFGEEQRAHESALSALVTAVETKDPYAVGHSTRIAKLAMWMAEPLSLGVLEVQALRFAAMLHDVGKVGVPTRIVRRPGAMTGEDLKLLAMHTDTGAKLVQGIDFLSGSLDGIRHHHERFDGGGYPDGLAGQSIPLFARIIAVADAFDSLTIDRPHRPAMSPSLAVDHLQQWAGSQFDPTVVEALAKALERHNWEATRVDQDTLAAMSGYFDHDNPAASHLSGEVSHARKVRSG